jgi:hypothetical protein
MILAIPDAELSGPVESDGAFVVAGVSDLSSFVGELEILMRMDGDFDRPAQGSDTLDGILQQRVVGSVLGESIDCSASYEYAGVRVED